jgi:hypothetical protein
MTPLFMPRRDEVVEIGRIQIDDAVPLAMVPFYYGSCLPVQHRSRPRATVSVFRVTKDFVPLTSYASEFVADWAINRRRPLPELSVRALLRTMEEVDPGTAKELGDALIAGAPEALKASLNDPDAGVRATARGLVQSH